MWTQFNCTVILFPENADLLAQKPPMVFYLGLHKSKSHAMTESRGFKNWIQMENRG
jgi:hypothetical protein